MSKFNLLYLFFLILIISSTYKIVEGADIIGTKAPEFEDLMWLNTEPISIEELKEKVVLIRFWLVDCPYCSNTAPSLVEFYEKYKDKGFIIIGIHHPKSERTTDNKLVKKRAEKFGFNFPVAQDINWKTINTYWLGDKKRNFTSSSILIDKQGVIRFVHDGGQFFKSDSDLNANAGFLEMDKKIQELLDE
ncbi:MAG: redoxin domain-containing protein [Thermodesulfobacteriota bacterium]